MKINSNVDIDFIMYIIGVYIFYKKKNDNYVCLEFLTQVIFSE